MGLAGSLAARKSRLKTAAARIGRPTKRHSRKQSTKPGGRNNIAHGVSAKGPKKRLQRRGAEQTKSDRFVLFQPLNAVLQEALVNEDLQSAAAGIPAFQGGALVRIGLRLGAVVVGVHGSRTAT